MTSNQHRPEIHFAPEGGILDAPAGILRDGDTWHLFFQYRPDAQSPARWGHTYSEDAPFEWLECDDVLEAQGEEGERTVRAGSVVPSKLGAHLYFTSVRESDTAICRAFYDGLSDTCQLSDDPLSLDTAVVREGTVVDSQDAEEGRFERFRTPCVVPDWASADRNEGTEGFLMLALTGPSSSPTPVILRSTDGEQWNFEGPLTIEGDAQLPEPSNAQAPLSVVVSPRIVRMRDEVDEGIYDVLLITLETNGIEISGYLVGYLEGTTFKVHTGFNRVDYGHDFTRPRNTNYTFGTIPAEERYNEATLFGLVNGIGRSDDPTSHPTWTEEGWANALSLPRTVTLQGGKLYQTPPRGLPEAVAGSDGARSWTGLLEVPSTPKSPAAVTVKLLNAEGHAAATIVHSGHELSIDRSSGKAFNARFAGEEPAVAPLAEDDSDSLTIVVDGSVVEVFADGGQVAMSSRVYFIGGCSGFEVSTTGSATVERSWERSSGQI